MASTTTIQASEYPIKSVTVFKSAKAEVVRTFSIDLKKGQNKIEIRGLASTLDTHSVRVSGLGEARLFDVVCTLGKESASHAPDSSSEIIRTLQVKRAALESEKALREQEKDILLQYAQTLSGEHVNPVQMASFLEKYVEHGRKSVESVAATSEQILQIDRQIDAEKAKTDSKRGTTRGKVDIVIVADVPGSVELKLTYIVDHVNWIPTYELHATTDNGKPSSSVSLHYRARVTQSTGEDWDNTSLTLSTVSSDTVAKYIPQLRPVKIHQSVPRNTLFKRNKFVAPANNTHTVNVVVPQQQVHFQHQQFQQQQAFQQQQQQQVQQQQQQQVQQRAPFGQSLFGSVPPAPQAAFGTSAFGQQSGFGGFGQAAAPMGPPPVPLPNIHENAAIETEQPASDDEEEFEELDGPSGMTEPTTIVSETPMAISFSVHGESTIPSDGVEHQVSVAVLPFEAKISHVTIPKLDPRVYLQCEVKNSSEYRLLPGPVSVILDDSYVSKTFIVDVNTGDNFNCTLGDDVSTKVTYSRSSRTVKSTGGAFAEVTNTTTYTTKITVHNKHQFPINELIVRDVIPTSEDKRAKIVLRKPVGLADAKDGVRVEVKSGGESAGLSVGWETVVDGKGGEKEGKFEWRWKVGSGSKVSLDAEWEVKVPGENAWVEMVAAK